jgi:hypothetical protein
MEHKWSTDSLNEEYGVIPSFPEAGQTRNSDLIVVECAPPDL